MSAAASIYDLISRSHHTAHALFNYKPFRKEKEREVKEEREEVEGCRGEVEHLLQRAVGPQGISLPYVFT